jgi:hypothetical protein
MGALALMIASPVAARAAVEETRPALLATAEGAPVYFMARVEPTLELLHRLGVDRHFEAGQLAQRLHVDPFSPQGLTFAGIEAQGTLSLSAFESMPGRGYLHHRLALPLDAPLRFSALLDVAAVSQALPLHRVQAGSPLAAAGVYATYHRDDAIAILRLTDQLLIVDVATSWGGRLPAALELARRHPLRARVPFTLRAAGARRLLADAAAALYVGGRELSALVASAGRLGARKGARERTQAPPARGMQCQAVWGQSPAAFNDLALVFQLHARELALQLGWGTSTVGRELLSLPTAHDAALAPYDLGTQAAATLSFRLASLAPFRELRRGGPLQDLPTLRKALKHCPWLGPTLLAVRHWPQVLGLLLDPGSLAETEALKSLLDIVRSELRNLDVLVRGVEAGRLRYALAATFPAATRPVLEVSLTGAMPPELLYQGPRPLVLYPLTFAGTGDGVAALGTFLGDRLLLTMADSRRSLEWAYTAGRRTSTDPSVPFRARLEGSRLRELATLPGTGEFLATLLDVAGRLGSMEAELTSRRDLLLFDIKARPPLP